MNLKFKNSNILVFLLLIFTSIATFLLTNEFGRDIIHFYVYSRLYYIPIVIGAFLYNYRYAIIFPMLAILGELSSLYLSDRSDLLSSLFEISIPTYCLSFILTAILKVRTDTLQKSYQKLTQNIRDMIDALLSALEAKDIYTHGHSERVSRLAKLIAKKMNLMPEEIEKIYLAARLHDIGKIGVSGSILNKSQKLSEEEFAQIMDHPVIGAEIVKKVDSMSNLVPIILHHHERYDGKGYPHGLKENRIPLGSRIIAVADSFDAMISQRPYRDPYPLPKAIDEIVAHAGSQFDPQVVNAFLASISEIGFEV